MQPLQEFDSLANGTKRQGMDDLLEEVRLHLGVPTVTGILRAAAEHPAFADVWAALRPTTQSPLFIGAASRLRITAAEAVRLSFFVSDHLAALLRLGLYNEIPKIKACVVALDWTAAREMLLLGLAASHGTTSSSAALVDADGDIPVPRYPAGAVLRWGGGPTDELDEKAAAVLTEVSEILGVGADVTVFGAMSAWPGYLQHAWRECARLRSGKKWSGTLDGLVGSAAAASQLVRVDWTGLAGDKLADLQEHLQPILRAAGEHLLCTAVLRLALSVPDGSIGIERMKPVRWVAPGGDHTARKPPSASKAEPAASA